MNYNKRTWAEHEDIFVKDMQRIEDGIAKLQEIQDYEVLGNKVNLSAINKFMGGEFSPNLNSYSDDTESYFNSSIKDFIDIAKSDLSISSVSLVNTEYEKIFKPGEEINIKELVCSISFSDKEQSNTMNFETSCFVSRIIPSIARLPNSTDFSGQISVDIYIINPFTGKNIKVNNKLNINVRGVTIVSFSDGTDEQVAAMIDAAQEGLIDLQIDGGWNIGDTRTINIAAFTGGGDIEHEAQPIDIVITSFDEYMECGNVLQFDFKQVLKEEQSIESETSSTLEFVSSEMYNITLPALANALPSWLSIRLKVFDAELVRYAIQPPSYLSRIINNKLALRSMFEIYGSGPKEGKLIPYYKIIENRIKLKNGATDPIGWWFRTQDTTDKRKFYGTTNGYNPYTMLARTKLGLAPFGCL